MNNMLVLPIIIPALCAIINIFIGQKPVIKRMVAFVSGLLTLIAASFNLWTVMQDGIQVLRLGNWPLPYSISLTVDAMSASFVFLSSLITCLIIVYSYQSIGINRERYYYYASVLFMLTGLNGAFSTGDIFNMFVFFEVFLMSSYVLMIIGGTKRQLQESIKYILVNVVSSSFFVLAVAMLYSVVGSLNMADISEKIRINEYQPIMTVCAVLFIFVFATKAGMFPLYFWLPGAYYAPPIPILALFGALLTKVGVYALIRTYSLFFPTDNVGYVLMLTAMFTIIFGSIGALAYSDMKKIIIYNIMIAVGVIIAGAAIMTTDSIIGALYYVYHDMLIKAALFMLVGIIIHITGETDYKKTGGLITEYPVLGWTFFIAALSLAGIPPLSGFYGKYLIVKAAFQHGYLFEGVVILMSSLVVLYSVIRIFINVFWGTPQPLQAPKPYNKLMITSVMMTILAVYFGIFAEQFYPIIMESTQSIVHPDIYSKILEVK